MKGLVLVYSRINGQEKVKVSDKWLDTVVSRDGYDVSKLPTADIRHYGE